MSDFKGIEAHDLLGLSEPVTKLIETVSCGVGKIYEPWHVRRMAKAKAKELEVISSTFNENLQLPVKYDDGRISIDASDANDLIQRAKNRILFQEMKKQQNIDSVIDVAYSMLEQATTVSKTPVDSDWISEFFDNVANVSNENMQVLWGKVLAGEVESPGRFSKRTLDGLKKLTQMEATIFQEVAPYVLRCPGDNENSFEDYFLLQSLDVSLLPKYNISFPKIMVLSEAGLISENTLINIHFEIKPNEYRSIKGIHKSIKIENLSEGDSILSVHHPAYFLTDIGKQIFTILTEENCQGFPDEYIADCLEEIKNYGIEFKGPNSNTGMISLSIIDS